jgi:hypothetical protein
MINRSLPHPRAASNGMKPVNTDTELVIFAGCAIFRLSKAFPSKRARQKTADGPSNHARNLFIGLAVCLVVSLSLGRLLGCEKIRKNKRNSRGNSMWPILRVFAQLVMEKAGKFRRPKVRNRRTRIHECYRPNLVDINQAGRWCAFTARKEVVFLVCLQALLLFWLAVIF